MNEVLNAILTRRSVRSYKPDPVPEDVLERILTAGQYAATGMNRQSPSSWRSPTRPCGTSSPP